MKHFIFLFLFSLLGIAGLSSVNPNSPSEHTKDGLLWKITGNGLRYESYLFGTMHNIEHTYLDSISGFREAFRSVQQIAIECDVFVADSIGRTSKKVIPSYILMPQDTTYKMLYNKDDYTFVDSILKKGNLKYFKYKPLFWNTFFNKKLTYRKMNNTREGMDSFILLMGFQSNKRIYFMETLEEASIRTRYLDSLRYTIVDLHQQASSLRTTLQSLNSITTGFDDMEKLYKEQKMSAIIKMDSLLYKIKESDINKQDKSQQTLNDYRKYFYKIMVPSRNEKWMKNILQMIQNNSSLIAVGVIHLIGNDGLITKLRELGYIVEPI